jgi:tripartite-type tricarboxylate transporter receptor subunit TctC
LNSKTSLICIVGPKRISPQIVQTLLGALKKAMEDPDFINVNKEGDMPIIYRGPEELAKHLLQMNEEVQGYQEPWVAGRVSFPWMAFFVDRFFPFPE